MGRVFSSSPNVTILDFNFHSDFDFFKAEEYLFGDKDSQGIVLAYKESVLIISVNFSRSIGI